MKRQTNPTFSGRGRGKGNDNSNNERSYTPNTNERSYTSNSWRNIAKKENNPSSSFFKGIEDLLNKEETPEPYSNIIKNKSTWHLKKESDIMLYLEQEDIQGMNDLDKLRQKYLLDTYYPTISLKARPWLKTIMMQKGMDITHYWNNSNQTGPPAFSKCIISEVIQPRNWAINPNQELPLVKAHTSRELYYFNYWDYQQAFYQVFLHQNTENKHTWMIKLCPETLYKGLPSWFFIWWAKYGADLIILPEPIMNLYIAFIDTHPVISKMDENHIIDGLGAIYFFSEAEIPWIWSWSLDTDWTDSHVPYIKRKYHNKWWTGIPIEEKVAQIEEIISKNKAIFEAQLSQEIPIENPMVKLARSLKRKNPLASEAEIQKKCLEYMKRQFFEAFDSTDTKSTKSIESLGDDILPDAQDPNEEADTMWAAAMGILDNLPSTSQKGKDPV